MFPKYETWDEFFDAFMEGTGEYSLSNLHSVLPY